MTPKANKPRRKRAKNEGVATAADESLRLRKQQEFLALFGTIEYSADYDDCKRERRGKTSA
ncbi:MAG TPA: hypothetical protein VN661_13455 [Candidatus Acidoferrales bacterium]|nr:hypothetical protein [Candidatus Acidoferrales bacterium]